MSSLNTLSSGADDETSAVDTLSSSVESHDVVAVHPVSRGDAAVALVRASPRRGLCVVALTAVDGPPSNKAAGAPPESWLDENGREAQAKGLISDQVQEDLDLSRQVAGGFALEEDERTRCFDATYTGNAVTWHHSNDKVFTVLFMYLSEESTTDF